jgi:hypothetical protein
LRSSILHFIHSALSDFWPVFSDLRENALRNALFLRDQGQSLFSSKSLVRPDGFVGKKESAALALPYHRLNRIEQVISRSVGIA